MVNTGPPKNRAPKPMKQTLIELKGEIGNSKMIGGDFNTLPLLMDGMNRRSAREQKTWTTGKTEQTHREWSKEPGCTFFSSAHKPFSKRGHIWIHKTSLSQLKKTVVIQSMFSDQNRGKLEISNRRKTWRNSQIRGNFLSARDVTVQKNRKKKLIMPS